MFLCVPFSFAWLDQTGSHDQYALTQQYLEPLLFYQEQVGCRGGKQELGHSFYKMTHTCATHSGHGLYYRKKQFS